MGNHKLENIGGGRYQYRNFIVKVNKDTRGTSSHSTVYSYTVLIDYFGGINKTLGSVEYRTLTEFKAAVDRYNNRG